MPFALLVEVRQEMWTWSFPLCLLYAYSDVFLCSASIVHMSVISLDRYLGISKPLKMRNKSRSVVVAKIAIVWLITTIISSPLAVLAVIDHSNILHDNICIINNRYYMIYGSTLSFLIPFVIMALTFLRTRYLLQKQVCALYSPPAGTTTATMAGANNSACEGGGDSPTIPVSIEHACGEGWTSAKSSVADAVLHPRAVPADSNGLRKTVARRKLGYVRTNSLGRSGNAGGFAISDSGRHKGSTQPAHKSSISSRTSVLTSPCMSPLADVSRSYGMVWNSPTPSARSGESQNCDSTQANERFTFRSQFHDVIGITQSRSNVQRFWRHLAYAVRFGFGSRASHVPMIQKHAILGNVAVSTPALPSRALTRSASANNNSNGNHRTRRRTHRNTPSGGGGSRVAAALRRGRHAASSLKRRSVSVELANEEKATRVLAFVFSCFFVCWTPFFLSNFAYGFCGAACAPPEWAASLFLWLGYTSSTLNPIIYTVFNERFRQAFWRILQCQCTASSRHKQNFYWQQQQFHTSSYAWNHQYSTYSRTQTPACGDFSGGKWGNHNTYIRGDSLRATDRMKSGAVTNAGVQSSAGGLNRISSPLANTVSDFAHRSHHHHHAAQFSSLLSVADMRKTSLSTPSVSAAGTTVGSVQKAATSAMSNLRRQSVTFSDAGVIVTDVAEATRRCSASKRRKFSATSCFFDGDASPLLLNSKAPSALAHHFTASRRYSSASIHSSEFSSINDHQSSDFDETSYTMQCFRYRKPPSLISKRRDKRRPKTYSVVGQLFARPSIARPSAFSINSPLSPPHSVASSSSQRQIANAASCVVLPKAAGCLAKSESSMVIMNPAVVPATAVSYHSGLSNSNSSNGAVDASKQKISVVSFDGNGEKSIYTADVGAFTICDQEAAASPLPMTQTAEIVKIPLKRVTIQELKSHDSSISLRSIYASSESRKSQCEKSAANQPISSSSYSGAGNQRHYGILKPYCNTTTIQQGSSSVALTNRCLAIISANKNNRNVDDNGFSWQLSDGEGATTAIISSVKTVMEADNILVDDASLVDADMLSSSKKSSCLTAISEAPTTSESTTSTAIGMGHDGDKTAHYMETQYDCDDRQMRPLMCTTEISPLFFRTETNI